MPKERFRKYVNRLDPSVVYWARPVAGGYETKTESRAQLGVIPAEIFEGTYEPKHRRKNG